MYLSGAPPGLAPPLSAHSQSLAERWKNFKAAGAMGIISFADPRSSDIPWSRSTLARLNPTMALTDPALIETAGMRLSVAVNPEHANIFLEGTGQTVQTLLELHRSNAPLPRFPLRQGFALRRHSVFLPPRVKTLLECCPAPPRKR